jgi:DNA-binding CsgD family transcriptional regulator
MFESSSASGRIRPDDTRVTRVALIGSPEACARLQVEVAEAFAIVGTFPDLASARAGAVDADAFLIANEVPGGSNHLRQGSGGPPMRIPAKAEDPVYADPVYADPAYLEPLTEREIEVLELLAEGLSNKGIGSRLGISDQTVKFHVASISGKLGTHTRTETVRRAVRRGLITL